MSIIGATIQKSFSLVKTADFPRISPVEMQHRQLRQLLRTAQDTAFGRFHGFHDILLETDVVSAFQRQVPATDYNGLYERWWSRAHQYDTPDVTWPGQIPYFALSSGTSQAATKYIPVTYDMLRAMKRGSRRMFFDLAKYDLDPELFTKQMLMVGSCTDIRNEGLHQSGDLSGIMGHSRPLWMNRYYRPGRHITDIPDWKTRIEAISDESDEWDIGFVVGNPAWVQLIFERILDKKGAKNIHEIWPNLAVFAHSGVFFEPYRPVFEKLLAKPVHYIESYLASEGFIAYQNRPGTNGMRLLTDCGVFYEFVPFNGENFDENGDLRTSTPVALPLEQVKEGETYALLLTTCSGAWRYLLGDIIQFTDLDRVEIRIVGRTKQFLSVCGEHLSIDNLSQAMQTANERFDVGVREFTVAGIREGDYWIHQWWISGDTPPASNAEFAHTIDEELRRLNEDYGVERDYALKDVRVSFLPHQVFYDWLEARGKMNGQSKIPRVLKGEQLADFQRFLRSKGIN